MELSIKDIDGSKQQLHITAHKILFLFSDHVVQEQYELRVTDSSEFSDLVTQTLCSAARLGRDYHYVIERYSSGAVILCVIQ